MRPLDPWVALAAEEFPTIDISVYLLVEAVELFSRIFTASIHAGALWEGKKLLQDRKEDTPASF